MGSTTSFQASTSWPGKCIASARCTPPLRRRWIQPSRLSRLPFSDASRPRRYVQRLTPAGASVPELPPQTLWEPSQKSRDSLQQIPKKDRKPIPRKIGYRDFKMDSCRLLVGETSDGQLDLGDVLIEDLKGTMRTQPIIKGEMPNRPRHYQSVVVGREYKGNVLQEKMPRKWVTKVYFIPIKSLDPYELNLTELYLMDDKTQTFSREPVIWLAPRDTPPGNLRLRVRKGTITIESVDSLPSWEQVVCADESGLSALSKVEMALVKSAAAGKLSWEKVEAVVGPRYKRIWNMDYETYEREEAAKREVKIPPVGNQFLTAPTSFFKSPRDRDLEDDKRRNLFAEAMAELEKQEREEQEQEEMEKMNEEDFSYDEDSDVE